MTGENGKPTLSRTETPPSAKGAKPGTPSGAGNGPKPARKARRKGPRASAAGPKRDASQNGSRERYARLPTGAHGLTREEVERDQRARLQSAMIELVAERGYQAVRILDLTQLAHVSRPTFYSLYADKEELFLAAYNEIAAATAKVVIEAYAVEASFPERMRAGMRAFADFTAANPQKLSVFLLGAFGAGPKVLSRRKQTVAVMEQSIQASSERSPSQVPAGVLVRVIIGGVREVAAARVSQHRAGELPGLADELAAWAACYPQRLPDGLEDPPPQPPAPSANLASERTRTQSRLPSGRHDLPREVIVKSQRERIVDATAAIVAEKGLAALTIPEIAARANVSHETFYEMYPTKLDAFLGAQKVGMHQALGVGVEAYEARMPDWPNAIADGLRAVIDFIVSEPAHAHLSIVDAFGASPQTISTRDEILSGFATYFDPGYELAPAGTEVPAIAAEAVVGGAWQVLHRYVDSERIAELPTAAPQLIYMLLTPFLGPQEAAEVALRAPGEGERSPEPVGQEGA
jgi:AcrR family transcriptional regulator